MDLYLLKDHWAHLANEFKDSERELYGQDGYATETLLMDILDFARFTRIRQWTLFSQKRGEEFEAMLKRLEKRGHSPDAAQRAVGEEELWKTTLELAEQ